MQWVMLNYVLNNYGLSFFYVKTNALIIEGVFKLKQIT